MTPTTYLIHDDRKDHGLTMADVHCLPIHLLPRNASFNEFLFCWQNFINKKFKEDTSCLKQIVLIRLSDQCDHTYLKGRNKMTLLVKHYKIWCALHDLIRPLTRINSI